MDVNVYIKNMIELEFMKNIIFKNNKEILNILNIFKPALKEDYSQKYNNKLSKLYSNKFSETEFEGYLNSIKDISLNNYTDFISEIANYYDFNEI